MSELFSSGRIIDLILILVVAEGCALAMIRRLSGRGPRLATLLPNLASGLFLLTALRAAIAQLEWPLIAAPLSLALIAHLIDLRLRWR